MTFAKPETIQRLYTESQKVQVVDSHTHIQDDILDFNKTTAKKNLIGTQASFNRMPDHVVKTSLKNGRLVRRLMTDITHGLFYSWFAQIAEGRRGRLDKIIKAIGDNSESERREAGKMMFEELQDSRYSEYAEWLRIMFSFYCDGKVTDPLAASTFDTVHDLIQEKRNDPALAARILKEHNITGYVTSIENRDKLPVETSCIKNKDIDLSYSTHPECYHMFDAHYFLWPEGATDFGLYLAGHKYESEKFLLNFEEKLGITISSPADLKNGIKDFFHRILWAPKTNPKSRIRYTNIFNAIDYSTSASYDITTVNRIIRYNKNFLRGDDLAQIKAFNTQAVLEALDEIGAEIKASGEEYGSCLQIALGVTYFMDSSREVQSFPVYRADMPQEAYSAWLQYPNIHFEYIIAHEQLYSDFSNAAKQVGNISVGPWWHYFRKHKIARMLHDQMSMGPLSSIASGFTDARFVEMLAAKYTSVRQGIAMALAELVDDPSSCMHKDFEGAIEVMKEIMHDNPIKVHHLPL